MAVLLNIKTTNAINAVIQRLETDCRPRTLAPDSPEHAGYVNLVVLAETLESVFEVVDTFLDAGCFPSPAIFNQLIHHLNKHGMHSYAIKLFEIAAREDAADERTYVSRIALVAKNDITTAIQLLEEAKNKGLAGVETYNAVIKVIAKSRRPDAAIAIGLLEEAESRNAVNGLTYIITLEAIAKSSHSIATRAFSGRTSSMQLWDELKKHLQPLPSVKPKVDMNLEKLNAGATYFYLVDQLQSLSESIRKHTFTRFTYNPKYKWVIQKALADLRSEGYPVSIIEDKVDARTLKVGVRPLRSVIKMNPWANPYAHYRIMSAPTKSALNPEAKAFVPSLNASM